MDSRGNGSRSAVGEDGRGVPASGGVSDAALRAFASCRGGADRSVAAVATGPVAVVTDASPAVLSLGDSARADAESSSLAPALNADPGATPQTPAASVPAVLARGLVKQFGARRGLDGVDLTLPAGAFLSIFGPNGAGKTTLLSILSLLSRPTRGSLALLGVDALEEPEALRARIGLISHRSMLYGDLTARENLAFFSSLYTGEPDEQRIDELLRLVELDHRRNDLVRTFSRGMQQRLSIARALVNDPALVLLDEPYSGLDPHAAELLDELIERVRPGRTLVMVSHDLAKGFDLCTHALILARSQVVAFVEKDTVDAAAFRDLYLATVGTGVA